MIEIKLKELKWTVIINLLRKEIMRLNGSFIQEFSYKTHLMNEKKLEELKGIFENIDHQITIQEEEQKKDLK